MKRYLFCLLIALVALLTAVPAGAQLEYDEFTLDNGLRVILLEDHALPMVGFYTVVGVGSGKEQPGSTGLSHMFEHMMFRGTTNYPGYEFDRMIEGGGGFTNAYTTHDMTLFYQIAPSEMFEQVVMLEGDRIENLLINEEHLTDERGAVLSERRMRIENNPNGQLWMEINHLAYGDYGYGWPTIGWTEDIENYTVEKLRNFFSSWYSVDRLTVLIVGDFEPGNARALMEKYYGSIMPGPKPAIREKVEPGFPENAVKIIEGPVPFPMFMLAFYGPPADHEDTAALDVIQEIMGGGASSRLDTRFVRTERSCYYVFNFFRWSEGPGLFLVGGQIAPGQDPQQVIGEIRGEYARLSEELVSERDLQKAKNQFWAGTIRQLQTIQGRGETVAEYVSRFGSPSAVYGMLDNYEAVTAEKVRDAARKYLIDKNSAVVLMVPPQQQPEEGGEE